MNADDDNLAAFLAEFGPFPPFGPFAAYNRDGDMIEAFWSDASCRAKNIAGTPITLHVSRETGEVVGVTIGCVRRLMEGGQDA
jgi:hypothetical protein